MKTRIRAALHRTYNHSTGLNYFLTRRIRPFGIGLLIIGIVLVLLAGGQASDAVFRMLAFGMLLGFFALCWLPLRRAKLSVERIVPTHATVGESVTLRYKLHNQGRRRLQNAWLVETPPNPRPSLQQFLVAKDPNEPKKFSLVHWLSMDCWAWLCDRGSLFEAKVSEQPLRLKKGGKQIVTSELIPHRRGLAQLDDLRVLLPDPLGFFQRCLRVRSSENTLAILPRRSRLPQVRMPGTARFQPGGDAASHNTGPSGEFVGLRDYQPGDPMRLIHWPSWARTGKPIVKEFEDTFFPRHGLILDTFPEAHDDELFEDAVSVAASFVSRADDHESLIDLMFISGTEQVVTAGAGTGRALSLLEVLAGVEASTEPTFDALKHLVLRHAEDLAGCLMIMAGWSQERQELLKSLRASGIETAAIVVCREKPEKAFPGVYFVRRSELARDLMKLPPAL